MSTRYVLVSVLSYLLIGPLTDLAGLRPRLLHVRKYARKSSDSTREKALELRVGILSTFSKALK